MNPGTKSTFVTPARSLATAATRTGLRRLASAVILATLCTRSALSADSLPPLKDDRPPANFAELWGDYDPAREPLDTEVVKEWQADGTTFRFVLYTVGTFKGTKSRMLAYYAFPTGESKLPAILHVHGGGQSASFDAVRQAADNGYAGMSINWGGNTRLHNWNEGDPNTDWGALDCTHPPQRSKVNHFGGTNLSPDELTIDPVESPRNSAWFPVVLSVRRAITFLERQPEVDPERIGVRGHSMGGRLTTEACGADRRIRAAVPSCGGSASAQGVLLEIEDTGMDDPPPAPILATADTLAYIPTISCPLLVLSPTNDFHGRMDAFHVNLPRAKNATIRHAMTPHMNHRHAPEFAASRMLWFEQHLKGAFEFPPAPALTVKLDTGDGVPLATLEAGGAAQVSGVQIFHSSDPHIRTRFWITAPAEKSGEGWIARLPLSTIDRPLYAFANVSYPLKHKVVMERRSPTPETFGISSDLSISLPGQLQTADVKATAKPSAMIDDFAGPGHDWYDISKGNPHHWQRRTRKVKDPLWRGPDAGKLLLDVKTGQPNTLVFSFSFNDWNAFPGRPKGKFHVAKKLAGKGAWETVSISLDELLPETPKRNRHTRPPPPPTSWSTLTELGIGARATVIRDGDRATLGGGTWKNPPGFRNLRWHPAS